MEQRVQLKTWRCGLDWLGGEISWEFWWIGGEPSEKQFIVGKIIDHGLLLTFHGWLGQLEDFFGMDDISMIEIDSCDGLYIRKLKSSSDLDVAYSRLEGFS